MMSYQSHELRAHDMHDRPAFRPYGKNSPRAKARLVVLALLADGRLDDVELERLEHDEAYASLGLTHEDFLEVLYEFCADVEKLPRGHGDYLLAPSVLEEVLGEVDGSNEREHLLRLIFDVIRSDGHLARGESELFWRAVDTWKFRAEETRSALRRKRVIESATSV